MAPLHDFTVSWSEHAERNGFDVVCLTRPFHRHIDVDYPIVFGMIISILMGAFMTYNSDAIGVLVPLLFILWAGIILSIVARKILANRTFDHKYSQYINDLVEIMDDPDLLELDSDTLIALIKTQHGGTIYVERSTLGIFDSIPPQGLRAHYRATDAVMRTMIALEFSL